MAILTGLFLAGALSAAPVAAGPWFGPSADVETDPMGERLRVRVGIEAAYGTLIGRVEKENSSAGIGSGGDRVSLRTDMNLPLFSWAWRANVALEPAPHFRIRVAAQVMSTNGRGSIGQGFRHAGYAFAPGTVIDGKLEGVLLDADFHFLPRQAARVRSEFGLFAGVRFAAFRHTLDAVGGPRVQDRTTGLWPRFGVQGYGELGSGMMIWGESAAGGWWSGDAHNFYAAASFDFSVGLGYVYKRLIDARVGYHYQTFGVWRDRNHDMERLTLERNYFVMSVAVRTP